MASTSRLGPDNLEPVPMDAEENEVQEISDGEIEEYCPNPPGQVKSFLPRNENKKPTSGKKKARDPQAKIGKPLECFR